MPFIFSDRLRLRAAEHSDISLFYKWINDPEVAENLVFRFPMGLTEEENWFESMLRRPAEEHVNVIEIQLPSAVPDISPVWQAIGNTSFMSIAQYDRSAEIGIMIGEKQYWDRGYGTEAMRTMLKHGFNTLNFHRIWLQVYAKNKRGIRAYEKAGFSFEGTQREGHYQSGTYHDVHIMSILRQEWDQLAIMKGN